MGTHTNIEWTDRTWNPVRGCSRVSEGCRNCYAERQAYRFSDPTGRDGSSSVPFREFVEWKNGHPSWTGKVQLIDEILTQPLRWKKPQRIFVNSMSDLFHESLPDEAIDRVFAVMALCPQHTFQVLTKRADRMRRYFCEDGGAGARRRVQDVLDHRRDVANLFERWPLPNVWLGVSVENQEYADKRIPDLLATPAAVRFVSYEPALGPVDFTTLPSASGIGRHLDALRNAGVDPGALIATKLDWIIVGGESGPGARPFDVEWARSVVKQCAEAGVACFVKQLGAKPVGIMGTSGTVMDVWEIHDPKGGDIHEWPEDLQVRQFPEVRA